MIFFFKCLKSLLPCKICILISRKNKSTENMLCILSQLISFVSLNKFLCGRAVSATNFE